MKAWEENDENDKNDWDFIVNYFNTKMVAINKYHQNNGDKTKYESAENVTQEEELADVGEELRKYILTLTQANKKLKKESAAIVKDKKNDEMAEQMMKLETMMATLLTNLKEAPGKLKVKDEDKPKRDDNKNNKFVWRFNHNMGG
jgi:hypothetical protein